MTLAASAPLRMDADGVRYVPISLSSRWITVIAAGGLDAADNEGETVTNPTAQITAEENRILLRQSRAGTQLLFSMFYAAEPTTAPTVNVFGRMDENDPWMALLSIGGSRDITFTADDTTDVTDGTTLRTTVVKANHIVDCLGCNEILVGVKVAAAGGGAAGCGLEVKFI